MKMVWHENTEGKTQSIEFTQQGDTKHNTKKKSNFFLDFYLFIYSKDIVSAFLGQNVPMLPACRRKGLFFFFGKAGSVIVGQMMAHQGVYMAHCSLKYTRLIGHLMLAKTSVCTALDAEERGTDSSQSFQCHA